MPRFALAMVVLVACHAAPKPASPPAAAAAAAQQLPPAQSAPPVTDPPVTKDPVDPDKTAPSIVGTIPADASHAYPTNAALRVDFGEAIDPATVNTTTFLVAGVAGTVSYAGQSAIFRPSQALAPSTNYVATVSSAMRDHAGNGLANAQTFHFQTAATADTTAPAIVLTTPVDQATGVSPSSAIVVIFSEPIDPSTLTDQTFKMTGGVTGTITTVYNVGIFVPSAPLAATTIYGVTLAASVADLAGNTLGSPTSFTFTTAAIPDVTPPTIVSTSPTGTGVDPASAVTVTFSEAIDPATVSGASVFLSNGVTGNLAVHDATVTLTPNQPLDSATSYTVVVTGQIADTSGNKLAQPATWSFTTAQFVDTTPPTVLWTTPANGDTHVAINVQPQIQFSEAMDATTLTGANIFVNGISTSVSATAQSATLIPAVVLQPGTAYSVYIGAGVKDLAGNALATTIVGFTTAPPSTSGPETCTVDTDCDPACASGTRVCDINFGDATGVCRDRCVQEGGIMFMPCPTMEQVCISVGNISEAGYPTGFCGHDPFGGFSYCQ